MHHILSRITVLCLLAVSLSAYAQSQDLGVKYAQTITADELKQHLSVIASDYYEGRETGTRGLARAAEYISKQFQLCGIPPLKKIGGYYQEYPLIEFGWNTSMISTDKQVFYMMQDFIGYASANNTLNYSTDQIVFLGYGIDDSLYSDYRGVDVKGKIVLVAAGEPMQDSLSRITGTTKRSDWSKDWRLKAQAATDHGVKCLLVIDPNIPGYLENPSWKRFLEGTLMKLESEYKAPEYTNNLMVTPEMAQQLLGKRARLMQKSIDKINATGAPVNFAIKKRIVFNVVKMENRIFAENVVGFVEGSDLKDEVIVVSGHFDHLGKADTIVYNGADDNGSGTVALIEIAEALNKAKQAGEGPRRSVMIIAFSGEEKGLLGSKAYAMDPIVPFPQTVANLNIDMIGRVDPSHYRDSNYVYVIGSNFLSTGLHNINEAAARNYSTLKLDYAYNSTTDPNRYYYRSDHYNFAKNGIPCIFYFSGVHDDYHMPEDEEDKILYPLLTERARLVFHTLWILANQDARIQVDVQPEE